MIQAIIFDLGGVLFTDGTKKFKENLSHRLKIAPEKLDQTLDGELGSAYRKGEIRREEFWTRAREELGLVENIDVLENEWIQHYDLIEGTKDIIIELSKNYKVYYLSDNVRDRVEQLNNRYNFLIWFEQGLFSHEVGVRKPDPQIYQLALEKAQVKAEEAVFIDDKEKNLIPAKELGMNTILFTSPDELRKQLELLEIL